MPESDSESFQRLFISFERMDTRIVSLVVYRNSSYLLGPTSNGNLHRRLPIRRL